MNHKPHGEAQPTHDGKFPTSPSINEQQSALFQTALEKMNRDADISQWQSKDKLTSLSPASAAPGLGGSAYVATIGEQLEVFHVVFAREFIHGKDAYINLNP